jgi:hypothetical protein
MVHNNRCAFISIDSESTHFDQPSPQCCDFGRQARRRLPHLPIQECYRRAWIVRALVEATEARSRLTTGFRASVFVPDFR